MLVFVGRGEAPLHLAHPVVLQGELDVRLPGKRNSNSHGARPVHLSITMIEWIRTRRSSIKNLRPVLQGDPGAVRV